MAPKLSLVIPTYNEAQNIADLCQKIVYSLEKINFDFELIIVDDNSPDETWRIGADLASRDSRIKLIRRMSQRGLGSAVVTGWESAVGEILGVIDGDLQHPPETLESLLRIMGQEKADIVIGSRYMDGGGFVNRTPWQLLRSRAAILLGLIFIPRILKTIKDPMSGFFILHKKVIVGKKLKPMGYKILLGVLAAGNYKKVVEFPYFFAQRKAGRTKADWQQYFISFLYLVKLRMVKN
jgi:dolichol-phosphate mannosyltransferase